MASTIKVNTIDAQSGSTVTIPTGKTLAITDTGALTIGGDAITVGSTNILHKTADYTIVTGDLSGKSELVIGTTAASADRTITLPTTGTAGASSCFITVVATTGVASGGTYVLKVQDSGGTEIWRGTQKGDFVRIALVNSLWVVLGHKETFYSWRYLSANTDFSSSAYAKVGTSFTSIKDFGNIWSTSNDQIEVPFDCYAHVIWNTVNTSASQPSMTGSIKRDGTDLISTVSTSKDTDGRILNSLNVDVNVPCDSGDDIEFWCQNNDTDATHSIAGGNSYDSNFIVSLTRRYS